MVLFIFIERNLFGQVVDAAVHAHAHIAAAARIVKHLDMFALFSAYHGRKDLKARAFGQLHDLIDDLVDRLPSDHLAALRAVRRTAARPEQAQIIVDFRYRAHRGTRVFAGGLLVDGYGG